MALLPQTSAGIIMVIYEMFLSHLRYFMYEFGCSGGSGPVYIKHLHNKWLSHIIPQVLKASLLAPKPSRTQQ